MVRFFYRNIRLLILTIVLIVAWGVSSFQTLPRQEDPELISRTAVVKTAFPGASAERVEALVTEPLEAQIAEVEEVKVLASDSRVGFSTVTVELVDQVMNAQPVWSKVRDDMNDAATVFPPGAGEPELDEVKIKAYTVIASITWDLPDAPNYAILRRYAEELSVQMRSVNGTEEVELFGEPSEEILVEISAPELVAVGLSPQQLSEQVGLSDSKASAGQLRTDRQDVAIEVENELETLEQIRRIPVQTDAGQFTRLSDIAQVQRGIRQPPRDLVLVSGQPAVVVGVLMKSGQRIDRWMQNVQAQLDNFGDRLPQGISLDVIFEQNSYVDDRIGTLITNLIIGALLVVVVTLVTMGLRSALIVGAALPLTTFAVFGWMTVLNIPIQQMSVTGLIIALGLLIDNAIVVVDEIQIELREGTPPLQAVVKTANYLMVPLGASTLTTVLAFLPIVLLPGAAGEFVGSIALNVILALISSLVLSLTVIAALAGRMLARSEAKAEQFEQSNGHDSSQSGGPIAALQRFLLKPGAWWNEGISLPRLGRIYRWTLERATAKPLLGMALAFTLPLIGFITATTLEQQFFPLVSRNQVQIEVEFAPQTAIAQTREQMLAARDLILEHPNVDEAHWFLGESAPKFYYNFTGSRENQAHYAQAMVQLNTDQDVGTIVQELQQQLNPEFPAARILVRQLQQGPPYDAPIEMRIIGPNLDDLRRLGIEARDILATVPDVVHVRDDLTEIRPKLGLAVDDEQAQQVGLTNTAIAQQLAAYLEGATGGSILESTEELPVRVRITDRDRADLSQIASLDLRPNQAQDRAFRPASALGNFDLIPQLSKIARRNEQRVNTVQGFITAGVLPSVVLSRFQEQLDAQGFELPPGYRYEFGGEQEERQDAVSSLLAYVPLLALIMLTALTLSLGSFRMAGIVAMVAVGSIGMALLSLKVFGSLMGFMAIVGTMGLVGIAINDTVIVLSAFNEDEEADQGDRHAVVRVVIRATRHVLTTTITTIAGFVPLLISGGPFWRPLAIAVTGGIAGSSILALYFTPAFYVLLFRHRRPTDGDRPSPTEEQSREPQTLSS